MPCFLCSQVFCYPLNLGLSLLHAFGYGLPVVTTDQMNLNGPEIEALKHEGNGLLYADGDVESLARTLERILIAPPLQQRLAAEALATVQNDFNLPKMVDGMEAAIRYAASQAKRRGKKR